MKWKDKIAQYLIKCTWLVSNANDHNKYSLQSLGYYIKN